MAPHLSWTVAALLILAASLPAQDAPQRGRLKKVDPDKGKVTITVDGKDHEYTVAEDTRLVDASNQDVTKRLRDERYRPGSPVVFKAREGKDVLLGMKLQNDDGGLPGTGIRTGLVTKLDLERMTITLRADDKEHEYRLTEETQVLDSPGKGLEERLKPFHMDSPVFFKPGRKDDKDVLVAIKLREALPRRDTSGLKPLDELGKGEYQGFQGGFYPEGEIQRPAAHEAAGVTLAKQVRPLDPEGTPSRDGKIVLLSVGMSNTAQASQGFQRLLRQEKDLNPHLVFVNGAQGSMTAKATQDPDDKSTGTRYWKVVDERLQAAGVTRAQVQAVWIKQADAGPTQGFPKYAQTLQAELGRIVQFLAKRFPNLKLVYLSSRTYGGYARTALNPEPYAYESGFAVKWLIEQQIKGDPALNFDPQKGEVKAPWLSWGPYLWANGSTPRADGFAYQESDFAEDGTHESASGQAKVGKLLLNFFKTDSTTRPWFLRARE